MFFDCSTNPLCKHYGTLITDVACQQCKLRSFVSREDVVGTQHRFGNTCELLEDGIGNRLPVCAADFLEVIDFEEQEDQRTTVARNVGVIAVKPIEQVFLGVRASERIFDTVLGKLLLAVLLKFILPRKLENTVVADLDLVAVLQFLPLNADTVDRRTITATQVYNHGVTSFINGDQGMPPTDTLVFDTDIGSVPATDHRLRLSQGVLSTDGSAVEEREARLFTL